jgi:hypothetical protein
MLSLWFFLYLWRRFNAYKVRIMYFSRCFGQFEKKCLATLKQNPSFAVQAHFCKQCQRRYPNRRRIHRWVPKFREHGTTLNLNAKGRRDTHSERPQSTRSPVNINAIREPKFWCQSRFLWKRFFLQLSKASWKIQYFNLLSF